MILFIARYDSFEGGGPMQTLSSASSTCRAFLSASEYTATVRIPILRAVLMTRHAISPRLAIRILWNMMTSLSERDVAVLPPGVFQLLVPEHRQRPADALAGLVGHDHVVDEAPVAGDEGVGELLLVLLLSRGDLRRVALLLAEDDLHRTLGPHHRDL